ncbi:MAG: pyridoxamine 5'-phosphate oxidase family protein [Gammaproteobacteria bacterium]|nr:pyridoxamine 5'-phosphate oxidase family protein [Gammaproteobacteria bacterium]
MGKRYDTLNDKHRAFIEAQPLFFVATAPPDGHINLSPKGLDSLRVLDANRILWLNLTGSGNETAAHLRESPRMTLMFCAFQGDPLILRVFGQARAIHADDADWEAARQHFGDLPGARQIIELEIELVQSSCGFGVPLMDVVGQREMLPAWADKKGEDGLRDYWRERNAVSLDGRPTGITDSN